MPQEAIKATASYKGKLVHTVLYQVTEKDPKTAIINSMYWNVISCTMASEPKWWEKFTYTFEKIKIKHEEIN